MKKTYYSFAILLTAILFIACQNARSVEKAEDIGEYAFDILKKFDTMSKEEYSKTVFTLEEVKEFGKTNAAKIGKEAQKEIAKLTIEDYNARIEIDFNGLKEKTKEYTIIWNDIEYLDYNYEAKKKDNIQTTRGELLFKYNDVIYSIKIYAFFTEDKCAVRINSLNRN